MQDISYTLRTSRRARSMRIAVYCDGAVIVTVPQGLGRGFVEQYVAEKKQWVMDVLDRFRPFRQRPQQRNTKKEFLRYKDEALVLAKNRVEYFNAWYGFAYHAINIKNQKSRWGSCSKKGNINFNYKIALLPGRIRDYIIVHELCHLGEFNHSKKFWDLVAKTMPSHRNIRNELKKNRL